MPEIILDFIPSIVTIFTGSLAFVFYNDSRLRLHDRYILRKEPINN